MTPRGFTAEEDARIRVLVAQNKTSREIAEEMGRSRNSIIGRCFRLGLKLRPIGKHGFFADADLQPRRKKKIKIARSKPIPKADLFKPLPEPIIDDVIVCEPIGLFDDEITRAQCRFVLEGDGISTIVCGAGVKEGSSYCPGHHKLCYRKSDFGTPKKKLRAVLLRRWSVAA